MKSKIKDDLENWVSNIQQLSTKDLESIKNRIEEKFGEKIDNIPISQVLNDLPQKLKKRFALYYTKEEVAFFLAELIKSYKVKSILDPSCGNGRLLENFSSSSDVKTFGCDVFLNGFTSKGFTNLGNVDFLEINEQGFLENKKIIQNSFDLIIMNPPFTRPSNLNPDYRKSLFAKFNSKNKGMSQMGLHGYFILHADHFLKSNGLLVAVLPAAILYSNYSSQLRYFLARNYSIRYIISYEDDDSFSDNSSFKEILLIAEKKKSQINSTFVSLKTKINKKNTQELISILLKKNSFSPKMNINQVTKNDLLNEENWLRFFKKDKSNFDKKIEGKNNKITKLKKLIKIRRGTESFGPEFFYLPNKFWKIQDETKIFVTIFNIESKTRLKIPSKFLVPGFISPKKYTEEISPISQEYFVSIPPKSLDDLPTTIQQYIEWGEGLDLAIKHYPFSKKNPWYSFLFNQLKRKSFFGNLLLIRKLRFNTMGVIAHFFEKNVPASKGFYIIQYPPKYAKFLAAWLNSSLFLEQIVNFRRRIADNWGELMISDVFELNCVDPSKISQTDLEDVKDAFDKFAQKKLPSIREQEKLQLKNDLDQIITNILQT